MARPKIVADEWQIEMIIDSSGDDDARRVNLGALCDRARPVPTVARARRK